MIIEDEILEAVLFASYSNVLLLFLLLWLMILSPALQMHKRLLKH
jgi:hypothetical protein